MEYRRAKGGRNDSPATPIPKNLRSPLLGLRHAMGSPAPRERESSDDSMESPRSLSDEKGTGKKSGAFPSIKVDKCDALPPVMRLGSASSEAIRKTSTSPVSPVSPDGVNSLYVPSPKLQRRSKDGRIIVFTENLESLKTLSRSEGDLNDSVNNNTDRGAQRSTRLDANFRPDKFVRPTVHLNSGHIKGKIRTMDVRRSPPSGRSLRLVPLQQSSRARSDNDLSAI